MRFWAFLQGIVQGKSIPAPDLGAAERLLHHDKIYTSSRLFRLFLFPEPGHQAQEPLNNRPAKNKCRKVRPQVSRINPQEAKIKEPYYITKDMAVRFVKP